MISLISTTDNFTNLWLRIRWTCAAIFISCSLLTPCIADDLSERNRRLSEAYRGVPRHESTSSNKKEDPLLSAIKDETQAALKQLDFQFSDFEDDDAFFSDVDNSPLSSKPIAIDY